jgi:hypothetical protein
VKQFVTITLLFLFLKLDKILYKVTFGDKKVAKNRKLFWIVKFVTELQAIKVIVLQLFCDHNLLGDAR